MLADNKTIIFFDAECSLCFKSVQYLISLDKRKKIYYSPLKGKLASDLKDNKVFESSLKEYGVEDFFSLGSVVLIKRGKLFIRGNAIFTALWEVGGMACLLGWMKWLPNFLYDWLYIRIAENRCSIFRPTLEEFRSILGERYIE